MNCNCGLTYVCSYRWWTVHSATIQLRSFHLHPLPLQYSICFCFPTDKLSSHQLQTTSQLSFLSAPVAPACFYFFPSAVILSNHSLSPGFLSPHHLLLDSLSIFSLFLSQFSLSSPTLPREPKETETRNKERGFIPRLVSYFPSKVLYCIWFYIRIMSLCSSFFNLFLSQKVTNHLVKTFFHF